MPSGPYGGDRPAFRRTEGGRKPEIQKKGEFQRWEVEGKKPSLNRLYEGLYEGNRFVLKSTNKKLNSVFSILTRDTLRSKRTFKL